LVTAEVSPYLRPGGRFDVHVSSLGDAQSLRGGVLWITPLQSGPSVDPVATAQGPLLISEASPSTNRYSVETTAALPEGGIMEQALPRLEFGIAPVLHLRRPDLVTASRIAEAINLSVAPGVAVVEDPGSVSLTLAEGVDPWDARRLAEIGDLPVQPGRSARVVIDSRSGTVIAGGDITIGEAVVSYGELTLAIGASAPADPLVFGDLRMNAGVSVQDIAAALHGVAAGPEAIAAVFESLRQVGALTAEVTLR
jgi:flagellar P-ring protein precursor FlgI